MNPTDPTTGVHPASAIGGGGGDSASAFGDERASAIGGDDTGGRSGGGPGPVLVDLSGSSPEQDAALGPLLLRHGVGEARDILRIWSPSPAAAFSRRDTLRPGYARAAELVAAAGFVPVVRPHGGSLAVYDHGSVVIDHIHRASGSLSDPGPRFRHFAEMHATLLRNLGVPAKIGPVPGEYCPGDYSLNAAGTKIVGSAQRVTKDGWLFSTVIQVSGASRWRAVLTPAYQALGYDFAPSTVGALEDTTPTATVPVVTAAVLAAYDLAGETPLLLPGLPDGPSAGHRHDADFR